MRFNLASLGRSPFNFLGLLLVVLFLDCSCKKDPPWLREMEIMMNRVNHEAGIVLPLLAADSSPEQVLVGLLRLEKAVDYSSAETLRLFRQYPQIRQQIGLADARLATQIALLRENIRKTNQAIEYWQKTLRGNKEFAQVIQRIKKKTKEANQKTREEDTGSLMPEQQ